MRRLARWPAGCGGGLLVTIPPAAVTTLSLRARLAPQLEEQLKDRLDAFGDDEAMAAVAAFEAKYKRLKEDYQVSICICFELYGPRGS